MRRSISMRRSNALIDFDALLASFSIFLFDVVSCSLRPVLFRSYLLLSMNLVISVFVNLCSLAFMFVLTLNHFVLVTGYWSFSFLLHSYQ